MSTGSIQHLCSLLLLRLAEPAVRSLALGVVVALSLKLFGARHVALRLAVWKGVLCAAVAMPLLAALVPAVPITASVFGSAHPVDFIAARLTGAKPGDAYYAGRSAKPRTMASSARPARAQVSGSRPGAVSIPAAVPSPERSNGAPAVISRAFSSISWLIVFAVLYVVVTVFFLARFTLGILLSRRLVGASRVASDAAEMAMIHPDARATWFSSAPRIAESELIAVPLTLGVNKPVVLLPADWREWDTAKLEAVLAHEFSHCARHDALAQRVSLLHRAIFWFSPLSWFVDRKIAELAEEASDEAALARGSDRASYARVLLGFFGSLQGAPARVWWQGLSMAKSGSAEKRVDRVLASKGAVPMALTKSLVFAAVLIAAPIVFIAASARPTLHAQEARPAPPPPPASPAAVPRMPAPPAGGVVAPVARAGPISGVVVAPEIPPAPAGGVNAPAALAPPAPLSRVRPPAPGRLSPVVPVAPVPPPATPVAGTSALQQEELPDPSKAMIRVRIGDLSGAQAVRLRAGGCAMTGASSGFVALAAAAGSCTTTNFSGDRLPSVSANIDLHEIAFVIDAKLYVIQDQPAVDRARRLFAPLFDLSARQAKLGRAQSALGEEQSALSEQVVEVRVKLPDLTERMKAIEAQIEDLRAHGSTAAGLSDLQAKLGELQGQLGEIQGIAGEEQSKLGQRQGALGEKQGELGQQQGELGEQQEKEAKKAVMELKSMLDDAIRRGVAKVN